MALNRSSGAWGPSAPGPWVTIMAGAGVAGVSKLVQWGLREKDPRAGRAASTTPRELAHVAGTTKNEPLMFNPFAPGFFDDRCRQYASIREHAPVHRSPLEVWVLFRYDDVVRTLRDVGLSVQVDNATPTARMQMFAEQAPGEVERGAHSILNIDP